MATTAVNYALNILQRRSECKYISITNANNAYGSEVVDRVLNARRIGDKKVVPDILLAPMDSKYFAVQGALMTELSVRVVDY